MCGSSSRRRFPVLLFPLPIPIHCNSHPSLPLSLSCFCCPHSFCCRSCLLLWERERERTAAELLPSPDHEVIIGKRVWTSIVPHSHPHTHTHTTILHISILFLIPFLSPSFFSFFSPSLTHFSRALQSLADSHTACVQVCMCERGTVSQAVWLACMHQHLSCSCKRGEQSLWI